MEKRRFRWELSTKRGGFVEKRRLGWEFSTKREFIRIHKPGALKYVLNVISDHIICKRPFPTVVIAVFIAKSLHKNAFCHTPGAATIV